MDCVSWHEDAYRTQDIVGMHSSVSLTLDNVGMHSSAPGTMDCGHAKQCPSDPGFGGHAQQCHSLVQVLPQHTSAFRGVGVQVLEHVMFQMHEPRCVQVHEHVM